MADGQAITAVTAAISSAGGVGLLWALFRARLARLETKVDNVADRQVAMGEEIAGIRQNIIPNGRERMTRIEAKDSTIAPRIRGDRGRR